MNTPARLRPPIRGVIFDMDGLLVDTAAHYFECGREVFRRRGVKFTEEHGRSITGRTTLAGMKQLCAAFGMADDPAEVAAEYEHLFALRTADDLRLTYGAIELLDRIEQRGIPKAVATSAFRVVARRVLDRFGLLDRFAVVLCSEDVTNGKPDPEVFLAACNRLGLTPQEALVLEDSQNGAIAARRAGCRCAVVPSLLTRGLDFTMADLVAEHLLDPRLVSWCG